MVTNLDGYKTDLKELVQRGNNLHIAMQAECFPDETEAEIGRQVGDNAKKIIEELPDFREGYQPWYSEAYVLIKQLLPDRLSDFVRLYEKPKPRKEISFENYSIEDYLQGLTISRGYHEDKVVGPDAAIPHFRQQLAILDSVKVRFESSLLDIRQLVQADLFDSELEAAKELSKKKFIRAAGAVAGVVLERHLAQVCGNHGLNFRKKTPTISDYNDTLKKAEVIELPQWRFIQHLADIRNLCDHSKKAEPTADQVDDLISGVNKTIKTLF